MPSLIDRINALFRRSQQAVQADITTTSELPRQSRTTDISERFQAENQRSEVVRKCREMYSSDPRAKKMIRMLARDMVKGGFVLKCDDDQAVEIAEALRDRLKLDQRLDDYVRLTCRDGDTFLEVSVSPSMEIAALTRKPTLEMHRASDSSDRFPDPARAYWYAERFLGEPPANAIWFAEWQIVHARWEHDEGSRYGTPMMASGTGHFKKVGEGELDIAVRRKTRAGMKFNHKFPPGTSPAEIDAYKAINQDALDNPFAAVQDYFGTVEIAAVQGDAMLSQIDDVQHQISTWMMSGEVPMELLGYGENLNRDVLEEKKQEYDETLQQLREWVTAELVQPILELEWLLHGIYPPNLDYSIEWQPKPVMTPAGVKDVAGAALSLQLLGVRPEVIWQILAQFLPGVTAEDLQPEQSDDGGETGRMDRIAGNFGGSDAGNNRGGPNA